MMWSLRLSVWRRISVNQSLNTWTVRCSEHSMCCRASVSLSALLPLMTSLPGLPPADWLSLCPDISFHFRRRWPALTGAESAGWAPSGVHLNKSACSRLISSSSFLLRSISSHVQSQRPSPCRCCWFFHFCSRVRGLLRAADVNVWKPERGKWKHSSSYQYTVTCAKH